MLHSSVAATTAPTGAAQGVSPPISINSRDDRGNPRTGAHAEESGGAPSLRFERAGLVTPPYPTPSGSSSSRLAMYARSASSTASSIGGGS